MFKKLLFKILYLLFRRVPTYWHFANTRNVTTLYLEWQSTS